MLGPGPNITRLVLFIVVIAFLPWVALSLPESCWICARGAGVARRILVIPLVIPLAVRVRACAAVSVVVRDRLRDTT